MSLNTGVVNIRGKEYQTVALRVQKFRETHPTWSITTHIEERTDDYVVMSAEIRNEDERLIATGHAEEYRKSSQINGTSALENCETSAIGRALAVAGFGGTEFASANEVQNAIHQQANKPHPKRAALEVAFKAVDSMASLQALWGNLSPEDKKVAEDLKNETKERVK
jgi:hypothetical protein